ncbi:ABC transporter permease [Variovorax sp. J22G21]|uniref:ABC transporter permease n=1 Tax=Variovorax fucosicus TaxID=3053517 RepID=UPI00257505E5|nr:MULTISPECIES: ABC transporter permease [unclassified Variovorax]MDM0038807.1 ABC transporter permease [Variovorax sp. J22R193]MDM0063583.1 ABC transporter permease [Variovorax sp. J22G21]
MNSTPLQAAAPAAGQSQLRGVPGKEPTAQARPLASRRFALEIRQQMAWPRQALILAVSLAIGMGISAAILVAAGVPANELLNEFVLQTLFDKQSLQAVLFQAAPMILVGIAASLAFRARFWNLGLEGQMIWGAIGATAISFFDLGPPALRLPLMLAMAIAFGLLWALAPALLKLRLGVNEIISSLMLNYIAGNFLLHLVYGAWKDPKDSFPYSPQFRAFERLPEWFGNVSTAAIGLALCVALLAWWFVGVSRAGLYLRFVDANPRMADAVGVPVRRMILSAVLLSGALSGIAGFVVVAGQEGRLTQAFHSGYGFSGILIAFLARNNPLAATVVAVLVAALFVAGRNLQVFYQIPFSMVQLIQAIVVICVASSDFFIRHRIRNVR